MRKLCDTDTSDRHLKAARYHMAALASDPATVDLSDRVRPANETLRQALKDRMELEDRVTETMALRDMADHRADDAVRDLHADVEKRDRTDKSGGLLLRLFHDGRASSITHLTIPEELNAIEYVISSIEKLGSGDPICVTHIPRLRARKDTLIGAMSNHERAVLECARARGREELAQGEVRRVLDANHASILERFGGRRDYADRYFSGASEIWTQGVAETRPPAPYIPAQAQAAAAAASR